MTWKAFTIGKDAPIEWNATKDHTVARLNGGKSAEVVLRQNPYDITSKDVRASAG